MLLSSTSGARARLRSAGPGLLALVTAARLVAACAHPAEHAADDARAAGLTPADFPEITADVFSKMDGGIRLTEDEIKGRNAWILWTAGNQAFWDRLARESYGLVDLLKTVDTRRRPARFAEMGLMNEPGLRMAEKPDEYGLWLDERVTPAPPGVDEKVYGRSSGIVGFRLYPNPEFRGDAVRRWDPVRYYSDPGYFDDPTLVRPYRIGVACGLCHVGPNPLDPPPDPANPGWENLVSAIGNQYFREGKVFAVGAQPGGFLWEMLGAQPPGTSDTSRTATDHINNPSSINAIFDLDARLAAATVETMPPGAGRLAKGQLEPVPHILKDGADSIGLPGAALRVYVNEGLYSQQWLTDHDLLLGLRPQRPFSIDQAFERSVYWRATAARVENVARFFKRIKPMRLAQAPGGPAYLAASDAVLTRGKLAFAERCAECHSSKQPPEGIAPRSPEARRWYRDSVMSPDFLDGNFLSSERRYPVSLIKTNACRALASNATAGHIWANFSSETYKGLGSVGVIETFDPADEGRPYRFETPAGGRGYYRPPSLISLWSSAPFLHNNSVGVFTGDPSVAGRMRAFDDAIEKLLSPERRAGRGSIWRTTERSTVRVPRSLVPSVLAPLLRQGVLEIGPIPKGTPINLLANVDPDPEGLLRLIPAVNTALAGAAPDTEGLPGSLVPRLMAASTCPDLVEDRGHEFGATLADPDKRALIAFLKTL